MIKLNFLYPHFSAVKSSCFSYVLLSSLLLVVGTANAICTIDDPVNQNPIKAVIQKDASAKLRLVQVASGMVAPNWGIAAPGDSKHLFVTDTVGQLWAINPNTRHKNLVLNVSKLLVPLGLFGIGYDERGLLGVIPETAFQHANILFARQSGLRGGAD